MNRLGGAVVNRVRRWLARRPVGRARVRRAGVRVVVAAAAAVVLVVVFHLAWPVALGIVVPLLAVYVAWLAVPGVVSPPEIGDAEVPAPGGPARQWDVRRRGVHAAISVPGVDDEVPPEYIRRDVDDGEFGVRARVKVAAERGGFVLLVGGSSVGKTRSAAQAVTTLLPDWQLVHPGTPGQVAALAAAPARQTVVWLDELQRYLDGKDGLTADVVEALVNPPHPAVVIGTLWPELYADYTAVPEPGGRDPHARERQLLGLATEVRIAPAFTDGEQARARAAAARDPRLKIALETAGYGLTQTLAAAPHLVTRWQDAQTGHPYAWAVLTAALDAARLGAGAPLPGGFLRAAAPGYLTSQQQAQAPKNGSKRPWTTPPVRSAAPPPSPPAGADMGQVAGYTPADYLIQHATGERRSARVPASTWDAALSHLLDPADAGRLADSASDRMLYCYAIPLFRRAADAGDGDAAEVLAELLAQRGDLDELRARGDAGDLAALRVLHLLLLRRGDQAEAHQVWRARADAGDWVGPFLPPWLRAQERDQAAARERAELLAQRGDLDGLRARAAAGDGHAARELPGVLAEQGRGEEAERLRRFGLNPDGSIACA